MIDTTCFHGAVETSMLFLVIIAFRGPITLRWGYALAVQGVKIQRISQWFMYTRDVLLVKLLQYVVAARNPSPHEGRCERRKEEGWQEEEESEADGKHREDHHAQYCNYESDQEGKDQDSDGEDDEQGYRRPRQCELGKDK